MNPPPVNFNPSEIVNSPDAHEVLVDVFGQYILWLRTETMTAFSRYVRDDEARKKLGKIRRQKFDDIATLTTGQQEASLRLAEAAIDHFVQLLLLMFGNSGIDQRLGSDHAVRFILEMEILNLVDSSVSRREILNRGGKKFFGDYWGKWINRSDPDHRP